MRMVSLRGLKAPPRRAWAPAFFTAMAVSTVCSSLSTVHGPAITVKPRPILTESTGTTVLSPPFNEASLRLVIFPPPEPALPDFHSLRGSPGLLSKTKGHGLIHGLKKKKAMGCAPMASSGAVRLRTPGVHANKPKKKNLVKLMKSLTVPYCRDSCAPCQE